MTNTNADAPTPPETTEVPVPADQPSEIDALKSELAGLIEQGHNVILNFESDAQKVIESLTADLSGVLSRAKPLMAELESLAKTDVSVFSKRLRALEGAVYSVAGPILGSAEHDAHGLLTTFFNDVKSFFVPKPATPAATQTPATPASAAESSGSPASPGK